MSQPIKAGDEAIVVSGLGRAKSPNVGKRVRVLSLQGEHSQHGRIWRCSGVGIKQLGDAGNYIDMGWADFPASWLQKIDPTPLGTKQAEDKEITA